MHSKSFFEITYTILSATLNLIQHKKVESGVSFIIRVESLVMNVAQSLNLGASSFGSCDFNNKLYSPKSVAHTYTITKN